MKTKHKMLIISLALLTLASPSFAWMGGWQSYYGNNQPSLSAEQQQQVQQVEKRYSEGLAALEAQLNAKQSELIKARADGSTTMAQYNALQSELGSLENNYRAKIGQANQEIWRVTGSGTAAWFVCDYQSCNLNHGRNGMMRGGMMRNGMMMSENSMRGGQRGGGCW